MMYSFFIISAIFLLVDGGKDMQICFKLIPKQRSDMGKVIIMHRIEIHNSYMLLKYNLLSSKQNYSNVHFVFLAFNALTIIK